MTTFEARRKQAKDEFKDIISSYMLPLFDVRGTLKCQEGPIENSELVSIIEQRGNKEVYFYPCIGTQDNPSPFFCKVGTYSSSALKKPAAQILQELLKVSEYEFSNGFHIRRHYGSGSKRSSAYKKRTLDLAFELGMCEWMTTRTEDAITLHTVICRMIEWSSRTYEGKNVPFGIAIDFNLTAPEGTADYLHFLENDSSAVFTDGVFSGILLDRHGKVVSFLTRDSVPPYRNKDQEIFVPYQFVDIARHCVGMAVGIIVLTNGEILLIKNQAVCFAKRGRRWVCFDWQRVYANLRPYFLYSREIKDDIILKNLQSIYCTLLDVSFAHTGGCLAIIHPDKLDDMTSENVVADRFDLYTSGTTPSNMRAENREKAEILSYLLRYPQQKMRSFFDLEKPLRREILSLDGATVVSLGGDFYCAGSIVAVPGGSSGGGRTAAAKQLAKFGVGIKISEDGYIEAFGVPVQANGSLVAEPKPRIIPLFKFR